MDFLPGRGDRQERRKPGSQPLLLRCEVFSFLRIAAFSECLRIQIGDPARLDPIRGHQPESIQVDQELKYPQSVESAPGSIAMIMVGIAPTVRILQPTLACAFQPGGSLRGAPKTRPIQPSRLAFYNWIGWSIWMKSNPRLQIADFTIEQGIPLSKTILLKNSNDTSRYYHCFTNCVGNGWY